MNTMYIREHMNEDIHTFLKSPECFYIIWKDSIFEESDDFDEVK